MDRTDGLFQTGTWVRQRHNYRHVCDPAAQEMTRRSGRAFGDTERRHCSPALAAAMARVRKMTLAEGPRRTLFDAEGSSVQIADTVLSGRSHVLEEATDLNPHHTQHRCVADEEPRPGLCAGRNMESASYEERDEDGCSRAKRHVCGTSNNA